MIKAVLFDLDGTLVNSLKDLAQAGNYALAFFGFPIHEEEKYKYFVGNGMAKLIERILPEERRDDETLTKTLAKFFDYYNVHYADNTGPYEGINKLIINLKERNIKTAVVTNKAQAAANEVVSRIFGNTLGDVFGQSQGVPTKPDPTLAFQAMDGLGVRPEECIFAGDSGMDVKTGVNSGALPVGVLWGFRKEDELLESGARYVVSNPHEIIEIIDKENFFSH